jgi:hypothetical protein
MPISRPDCENSVGSNACVLITGNGCTNAVKGSKEIDPPAADLILRHSRGSLRRRVLAVRPTRRAADSQRAHQADPLLVLRRRPGPLLSEPDPPRRHARLDLVERTHGEGAG